MKKSTLLTWAIIFGGIALLIFQNQAFFMAEQSLRLNLGVTEEYHSPQLPVAVPFIIFFLAGVVIAYLFNISVRFKARRTIKKLNATMASHSTELAELKTEIDCLKRLEAAAKEQSTPSEFELGKSPKFPPDSLASDSADQTGSFSADTSADDTGEFDEDVLVEKKL